MNGFIIRFREIVSKHTDIHMYNMVLVYTHIISIGYINRNDIARMKRTTQHTLV